MANDSTSVMIGLLSSLDDKGFKAAQSEAKKMGMDLQRASDTGTVSMNKLEAGSAKLRAGFVETAMRIGMVWMSLKKMVDASIEQHRADVQLRLAIKNNTDEYSRQGMTIDQLTKKLKDYAGAREDATGIDDAATQQQMKLLLSMGVLPNQVERVTTALQDMAAGSDISVETMARAWGRLQEAPEEALGALSRAGVKIRKEQLDGMTVEQQRIFILEKLEEKFKGQAKAMYEASGDVGKASTAINNAIESIGDAIMPAIGAVASVVAEVAKAFNGLPAPVRGAVVAIGGAITMFLSGPIGMVAGAIATIGGLLTLLKRTPYDMNAVRDANVSLSKSLDEYSKSTTDAERKTAELMSKLNGTKKGTSEYEDLVKTIIKLNPKLSDSNISVASSYNQIANALGNASIEMQRKASLDAADKSISMAEDLAKEAIRAKRLLTEYEESGTSEQIARARIRYQSALAEIGQMRHMLKKASDLTGINYLKKFDQAFDEASKVGRFEGMGSRLIQNQLKEAAVQVREEIKNYKVQTIDPFKRTTYYDDTRKTNTTNNQTAVAKTPYDITALMRQLEALKNINQYGEQAGNLINQLTEANNRYEDEVKKINSETHKSEADKQKALKAAADLRDEEIKRIRIATETAMTMADAEREMALESDDHKRRRLEIMKLAQTEIQKITDDEAKATALLDYQLKNKTITQAQYDTQRTALTKKYADARFGVEAKMQADLMTLEEMRIAEEAKNEQDRLDALAEQKRKEMELQRNLQEAELEAARKWDDELTGREEDDGYDLEALRRRWELEFNIKSDLERKLFQIEVEYLDELAKLERAYAKDTAEYKAGLKFLDDIKAKKIKEAKEPVREEYDLEALRRRWETEFNIKSELKRALFQIEVEYLDEAAKLERAYAKDTAEYKAGLKKLEEIKEKKTEDARRTAAMELIDTISGYYDSVISMASGDVMDGLQGIMSHVADQTQSAWLGWASFGVGVIKDFFGLFGSKSETALEKMQKRLQAIMDEMDRVSDQTGVSLAEKIFGSDSTRFSEKAVKDAEGVVKVWRDSFPDLASLTDEQMFEFREALLQGGEYLKDLGISSSNYTTTVAGGRGGSSTVYDPEKAMETYERFVAAIRSKYGANADFILRSLGIRTDVGTEKFNAWLTGRGKYGGFTESLNNFYGYSQALAESAGKAAEALQLLDDAKVRDALATYKEQLADIDHRLKTGKLTDEEAIKAQLDVYDQMLLQIESLDESTEKEAARNKLLEERYALEQNLLALQNKEKNGLSELLATEQGRAIQAKMDELEKIQRMIDKGQLSDNMANAVVQQDLYRQIISGLKSLGADKSVIQDWEDKLIALVKGQLGENQYNALSGTGSQVLLPNGVIFDTEEVKKNGQRALAKSQRQLVTAKAQSEAAIVEAGMRRAMMSAPPPEVNVVNQTTPTKTTVQQFHVNMQLPNDMIGYIMRAIKNQTGHNTWPSGRG